MPMTTTSYHHQHQHQQPAGQRAAPATSARQHHQQHTRQREDTHTHSHTMSTSTSDPQHQQQPQEQQTPPAAKRRGRPPGSKNRATLAKESTLGPLLTQVLQVPQGQDVCATLQQLAASRSCSLTVLSASGTLSSATLAQQCGEVEGEQREAEMAVQLTGSFTVLAISGSILQPSVLPADASPTASQQESSPRPRQLLSASLASPSGGVVGGAVVGALIAHTPVLLVVGLFGGALL